MSQWGMLACLCRSDYIHECLVSSQKLLCMTLLSTNTLLGTTIMSTCTQNWTLLSLHHGLNILGCYIAFQKYSNTNECEELAHTTYIFHWRWWVRKFTLLVVLSPKLLNKIGMRFLLTLLSESFSKNNYDY